MNRLIVLYVPTLATLLSAGVPLQAGELVPYQLPAMRPPTAAIDIPVPLSSDSPKLSHVVPESTYQRFATQVRTLPKADRDKLTQTYTQSRDAALKKGDNARAFYYFRLLNILKGAPESRP